LVIQGISILILNFKIKPYLGIFLTIAGLYFLESSLSKHRKLFDNQSVFLKIFGWDRSSIKYFVHFGFTLIIFELIAIRYFFNNYLGDTDIFGLSLGLFWILYPYIPGKYSNERDFLFLFLNTLYFIMVIPAIFELTPFASDNYFEAKDNWIEKFITRPLVHIFQLMGYYSFAEGNKIFYVNNSSNLLQSVHIAPMCSGIYSIKVFISAFGSYLVVFNNKLDSTILSLTLLGLAMSYISNIIRLVMVILAGHYYGPEALYWTHQNLGWLLFTLWMFLFWAIFDYINRYYYNQNNISEM